MQIFTSTTHDGNMDFRFGEREEVENNRKKFLEKCGLVAGNVAVMRVEHLDKINDIAVAGTYVSEALVTYEKGLPLMLLTADCYPCVIYDPVHEVVALLHLGWRPTGLLLVEKVIAHMQQNYSSRAEDIEVHFGPGISKESYVAESPSQITDPAWQPYLYDVKKEGEIKKMKTEMHVDILGYALAQCKKSGIMSGKIYTSGIDTYTSIDYFSHYRATRDGVVNGRFATVVAL